MAASTLLSKLVALVIGVVIGAVAVGALTRVLSPSAADVANQVQDIRPGVYGTR